MEHKKFGISIAAITVLALLEGCVVQAYGPVDGLIPLKSQAVAIPPNLILARESAFNPDGTLNEDIRNHETEHLKNMANHPGGPIVYLRNYSDSYGDPDGFACEQENIAGHGYGGSWHPACGGSQ